ncbi:hypothetical protein CU097_004129, partial [Rhizopus azygosporus]
VERMAAEEGKEKTGRAMLDDNEENEYEVWRFISRVELGNSADILGFYCSSFLKKYFEYQSPGGPDQVVFGCSMNHKEGSITSFFVNLCLKVNTNRQNGPRTTMKELTYIGEAISYLRYTSPYGSSRSLALVKVFDVKTNKDVFGHTRPSSATFKIKVANVDEIVSLCGRSI